jgi:hypothetical protein
MRVIDDFLDREAFLRLRSALEAPAFPWSQSRILSTQASGQQNRQLVHGFFLDRRGVLYRSPAFPLVQPVVARLGPAKLIKVKANLTGRQESHVEYGLHVDTRRPGAMTAILYLNTNDGYTVFEDGEQVASVANRAIVFDAARRHTGASCTDVPSRLVLNLNFVPEA